MVVIYNPDKITTPPKSYADLFDPKYKGRVGYSDILYSYNIAAANIAAGGKPDDLAAGQARAHGAEEERPEDLSRRTRRSRRR